MKPTTDSKQKRKRAFATIGRYLVRYKRALSVGAVCLVVTNLLLLVGPWILKLTIDELQTGITRERLVFLAVALVVVSLVSGIFRFLMRRIMIGVSRKIEFDMRDDYFGHLTDMSNSFYNKNRTGDLMARATNDLNAVRALVGPGVMYSLNTLVLGGLALALMLVLSWKLTVIALLPMVILAIGMYYAMRLIHLYFEKVQESFSDLNTRAQENLSGMRVVRAYAREDYEIAEFDQMSQTYVKVNMKLFKVQSFLSPLFTSVASLGGLFILGYGGKQVIDSTITLGTFVAFNGYLTMLVFPTIALGWVMNIMERGLASMQRINAVTETPPDIVDVTKNDGTNHKEPADRSITFDNVSFSYDADDNRRILKDLSFEIKDGETVAIVGPTGSGKSTLVSLMLRLFEPGAGVVRVGGVPVESMPLSDLRTIIGLIPQDIFLFSETIGDNIAFGVTELDDPARDRVTRVSAIYDEIQGFPANYQTMIGERGINLSGGQKQRLAIARALAKDPDILILDDALSSVDTDTEERILASLRDEMKKRTSIIISHRMSTVREADRILVLDDGVLAEQGSHETLISNTGLYADMFHKQQLMHNLERN